MPKMTKEEMLAARDRGLAGALYEKPQFERIVNSAESSIERLHMIYAMQQFVFDHYLMSTGSTDEALERIALMFNGHVKRTRKKLH